ncbi:hypothetical protein ACJX0J_037511, partial [Zea mays]
CGDGVKDNKIENPIKLYRNSIINFILTPILEGIYRKISIQFSTQIQITIPLKLLYFYSHDRKEKR